MALTRIFTDRLPKCAEQLRHLLQGFFKVWMDRTVCK